jgi:hypothetical protein
MVSLIVLGRAMALTVPFCDGAERPPEAIAPKNTLIIFLGEMVRVGLVSLKNLVGGFAPRNTLIIFLREMVGFPAIKA